MKCECGNNYTVCTCGTAHLQGSASAEHYLNCKRVDHSGLPPGLFNPNNGYSFPKWECPGEANMCPVCWHNANEGKDNTGLTDWAKSRVNKGGERKKG